jgi:hypothetical protein
MAGVTKSGMRSVFDRTNQKNKDEPNARENDYSLYFLLLFLLFLHFRSIQDRITIRLKKVIKLLLAFD